MNKKSYNSQSDPSNSPELPIGLDVKVNKANLDAFAQLNKFSALRLYIIIICFYSGNLKHSDLPDVAKLLNTSLSNIQRILRQLIKHGFVAKGIGGNWYHVISYKKRKDNDEPFANACRDKDLGKINKNPRIQIISLDVEILLSDKGLKYLRAIYYTSVFKTAWRYSYKNTRKFVGEKITRHYNGKPFFGDKNLPVGFSSVSASFVKSCNIYQHISILDTSVNRWAKKAESFGLISIKNLTDYSEDVHNFKTFEAAAECLIYSYDENAQLYIKPNYKNGNLESCSIKEYIPNAIRINI